ncbi:thioredoxin-related transmembrane protein 1-like [Drosophila pseudoobscura]|uniref:Thioredoxin-related transmembrane protein 1-like n=1 Tax=Drosophila pseudoobscura pseudoobscura TaxID=46245 RepID=A0A6I8V1M6_DROPS|nr:thioredoxin-related transmembrane protein 1 [Drosophila pseudoobscura]
MNKYNIYALLLTAFLGCTLGKELCPGSSGERRAVVHLDEGCWEQVLKGEWMVGFCLPLAKNCSQFESVWTDFATAMQRNESRVEVATMLIEYTGTIVARFSVNRVPSILHVRNGSFRELPVAYTVDELMELALWKWNKIQPMTFWRHPNGCIIEAKVRYLQAIEMVFNTKLFGGDYNRASLIVGVCSFLLFSAAVTAACAVYSAIKDLLKPKKIQVEAPKMQPQSSTAVLETLKSSEQNFDSATSSCLKLTKID